MTAELKPVAYTKNGVLVEDDILQHMKPKDLLWAIPEGYAVVEKDLLADGGVAQKAFWHAFEQAKHNNNMNIRNSWEEYKTMLNKTGDK